MFFALFQRRRAAMQLPFNKGEFLTLLQARFKADSVTCKNDKALYLFYADLAAQTRSNDLQTLVSNVWVLPRFIDFVKWD